MDLSNEAEDKNAISVAQWLCFICLENTWLVMLQFGLLRNDPGGKEK